MKHVILVLRIIAAGILFQTLFFKFTGAPESVYIFTTVGIEPWGRWGSGVAELIASILLLVPATQAFGAVFAIMIMAGAIMSHILFLGINVQNDNGLLFFLALTVLICSGIIAAYNRSQLQKFALDALKWTK
ncbi:MAG: DoxX family membrane protein [Pseudobdellovibrio sp.]